MDATTTAPAIPSIRQRFYAALLRATAKEPVASVQLKSIADTIGCHPSLLTRYLRQAAQAGWLRSGQRLWGVEIEVLDRPALETAAGVTRGESEESGLVGTTHRRRDT